MTTPAPPVRYLTATHSISTAGRMRLTMYPDADEAETVLELGALGYLYECHMLLDTASPSGGVGFVRYPSPADRIAAAEAEVARLHRQNAHLTEEVADMQRRLTEQTSRAFAHDMTAQTIIGDALNVCPGLNKYFAANRIVIDNFADHTIEQFADECDWDVRETVAVFRDVVSGRTSQSRRGAR